MSFRRSKYSNKLLVTPLGVAFEFRLLRISMNLKTAFTAIAFVALCVFADVGGNEEVEDALEEPFRTIFFGACSPTDIAWTMFNTTSNETVGLYRDRIAVPPSTQTLQRVKVQAAIPAGMWKQDFQSLHRCVTLDVFSGFYNAANDENLQHLLLDSKRSVEDYFARNTSEVPVPFLFREVPCLLGIELQMGISLQIAANAGTLDCLQLATVLIESYWCKLGLSLSNVSDVSMDLQQSINITSLSNSSVCLGGVGHALLLLAIDWIGTSPSLHRVTITCDRSANPFANEDTMLVPCAPRFTPIVPLFPNFTGATGTGSCTKNGFTVECSRCQPYISADLVIQPYYFIVFPALKILVLKLLQLFVFSTVAETVREKVEKYLSGKHGDAADVADDLEKFTEWTLHELLAEANLRIRYRLTIRTSDGSDYVDEIYAKWQEWEKTGAKGTLLTAEERKKYLDPATGIVTGPQVLRKDECMSPIWEATAGVSALDSKDSDNILADIEDWFFHAVTEDGEYQLCLDEDDEEIQRTLLLDTTQIQFDLKWGSQTKFFLSESHRAQDLKAAKKRRHRLSHQSSTLSEMELEGESDSSNGPRLGDKDPYSSFLAPEIQTPEDNEKRRIVTLSFRAAVSSEHHMFERLGAKEFEIQCPNTTSVSAIKLALFETVAEIAKAFDSTVAAAESMTLQAISTMVNESLANQGKPNAIDSEPIADDTLVETTIERNFVDVTKLFGISGSPMFCEDTETAGDLIWRNTDAATQYCVRCKRNGKEIKAICRCDQCAGGLCPACHDSHREVEPLHLLLPQSGSVFRFTLPLIASPDCYEPFESVHQKLMAERDRYFRLCRRRKATYPWDEAFKDTRTSLLRLLDTRIDVMLAEKLTAVIGEPILYECDISDKERYQDRDAIEPMQAHFAALRKHFPEDEDVVTKYYSGSVIYDANLDERANERTVTSFSGDAFLSTQVESPQSPGHVHHAKASTKMLNPRKSYRRCFDVLCLYYDGAVRRYRYGLRQAFEGAQRDEYLKSLEAMWNSVVDRITIEGVDELDDSTIMAIVSTVLPNVDENTTLVKVVSTAEQVAITVFSISNYVMILQVIFAVVFFVSCVVASEHTGWLRFEHVFLRFLNSGTPAALIASATINLLMNKNKHFDSKWQKRIDRLIFLVSMCLVAPPLITHVIPGMFAYLWIIVALFVVASLPSMAIAKVFHHFNDAWSNTEQYSDEEIRTNKQLLKGILTTYCIWLQFCTIMVLTLITQSCFNWAHLLYRNNSYDLTYLGVLEYENWSRSAGCYLGLAAESSANVLQLASSFIG